MKSQIKFINHLAWGMIRKQDCKTWKEAFRAALRAVQLATKMMVGIVEIKFVKKSTGELRTAKATLSASIIPGYKPSGEIKTANTVRFFDTEIGQWRSFVPSTLL